MKLAIQICTIPFTNSFFYQKDIFLNYSETSFDSEKWDSKINELLSLLDLQLLRNIDQTKLLISKFFPIDKFNGYQDVLKHYLQILSQLGKYFLTHRNGRTALKYWKSKDEEDILGPYENYEKILLWHTLNQYMVVDLLVASYYLDNMKSEVFLPRYFSTQIMLEDLQLDKILSQGLAETHLHWKAGIEFDIVWRELMNPNRKNERIYSEAALSDAFFDKEGVLGARVKVAAVLRYLMAEYLTDFLDINRCFSKYVQTRSNLLSEEDENLDTERNLLLYLCNLILEGKDLKKDEVQYKDSLYLLFENLISTSGGHINRDNKEEDVLRNLGYSQKPDPELLFLFRSLKYMKDNSHDNYFSKLFWQYIRIKNTVFQNKVQLKSIKGLEYFQSTFKRATELSANGKKRWLLTMKKQLQNRNMKKIEFRIGSGTRQDLVNSIRSFLMAYKEILKPDIISKMDLDSDTDIISEVESDVPEMGLIVHFNKRKDYSAPKKCWQFQDARREFLHYGELQQTYFTQAQNLRDLRESIPNLDNYIIGIDAASIENNTEPWVFAPVFEEVRDSKTHKTLYESTGKPIKTLGFTFHVGEDFRHLMTGLRHIDEVIEHFKFHAGDRIGHGIALGINPSKWVKDNRVVILPRIEYLENLVWLWGLCKNGNMEFVNWDIGFCEQSILKCAEQIFNDLDGITIYNLWQAYRDNFNSFSPDLSHIGIASLESITGEQKNDELPCNKLFCAEVSNDRTRIWDKNKLLHARHCKQYLTKMLEPVQIAVTDKDAVILQSLQSLLISRINSIGIVVETNPSSNTKIGEIENIFEHYIQNLNNVGLEQENSSLTMVTINTDDPSIFNTNLNNEFAYLFYSLLNKGYARSQVLKWIDNVRECGMKSSFLETRNLTRSARIEEIDQILQALR